MGRGMALPPLAHAAEPRLVQVLRAQARRLVPVRAGHLVLPSLRHMVLLLALAVVGLLTVTQWHSAPAPVSGRESSANTVSQTVALLEAEQGTLKQQITDLRARLAGYEQRSARGRDSRGDLAHTLQQQRLAAGVVPLQGPGIKIVADDTTLKTLPQGEDPNRFIIHEYELRDIVNFLWLHGAEAIVINGERLVSTTSIYCVGTTIMINDTRLSPPFEIMAIGDGVALERAMNDPSALRSFKDMARRYNLVFTVSREREVRVPAFNGSFPARHAQPGSAS